MKLAAIATALAVLLVGTTARADDEAPPAPSSPADAPSEEEKGAPLKVTPTGYVEVYYAYNFNRPANGITNYRGFDNRHNTFTLSNAALGATFEAGPVGGKIMLQIGSTPSTYYSAEPNLAGSGGANASNAELWKYIQEAYVTYKAPLGKGLLLQMGIVASPIGMEAFAVKDHWTWSRSNLFFGFPYYHTGVRATYEWTPELATTVSVFNGWNNVVDNNEEKSVQTNTIVRFGEDAFVNALYWGGIERSTGSVEGPYWRHHFDVVAQAKIFPILTAAAQADYGFEPNRIGTARWWAVAAATRLRIIKQLHFVLRGDRFTEHLATDATRSSAPLFFGGAEYVTSGTATLDLRPYDQISFRLEGRHDIAEQALYFRRDHGARSQTTALIGATAWF